MNSVYKTWDRLNQWAKAQWISDDRIIRFALCHDNPTLTPKDKCRYDAAIVVDERQQLVEPFTRATIPSGKYAVAYYKDAAEKINSFMSEFCSQWLCDSGYEPDNVLPLFNYLNDPREDGVVEMNIYIKFKELVEI